MLRKNTYEQLSMTDGRVSFDPVDGGTIERLFKKDIREKEEKLMLAVLSNALEYFQKYVLAEDERGQKLFEEAEEWFVDKNSDWLFSFANICETLQLHPDYIRQGLMSWKEAKRKGHSTRARGARLMKTRVGHASARLSKTG
jgi:hypothetical protein